MRKTAALAAVAAILLISGKPGMAASSAVQIEQLGQQRTPPASAAQVAQPPTQTQRSGAATIQSTAPAQSGAASANVAQARAQIDLCEKIADGQSRPVQGLDCSAGQMAALQQQLQAESLAPRPTPVPDVNSLQGSIDAIGRDQNAPGSYNGVPPVVILGPH